MPAAALVQPRRAAVRQRAGLAGLRATPEECRLHEHPIATQALAGLAVTLVVATTATLASRWPLFPFPKGFRSWQLVRSTVVDRKARRIPKRGGIHHYYANREALEGYRTGALPERLRHRRRSGLDQGRRGPWRGMLFEGDRRFVDVMVKNDAVYKDTGGWGYEHFDSPATSPTLSQAARASAPSATP